jgi:U3 small nucleolar RNA-associated protein 11
MRHKRLLRLPIFCRSVADVELTGLNVSFQLLNLYIFQKSATMLRRHDVAKKQHRERAQPLERKKWGLLEKKKDYKLRAQDFHRKEAQLKILRKKASERNADEYDHGMVRKSTDKKGILITGRGSEVLSNDAAKLLKTQDSNYIKTLSNNEKRQIEKFEKQLLFTSRGDHTVFVDNKAEAVNFSPTEFFGTTDEFLKKRDNRLRKEQLEELNSVGENNFGKKRLSQYKLLKGRLERQAELERIQQEMDLQRELMKKGEKKKIIQNGKVSWKWKNIRKK